MPPKFTLDKRILDKLKSCFMNPSLLSFLADATVVLHAAFVLFVAGGQVLILFGWRQKWKWTRNLIFRAVHLGAIAYVVLEAWFGIVCPLTLLEHHLRLLAGEAAHQMSFIGYWVHRLLFYSAPAWVFTLIYTMFGLLVLLTLVFYPPRFQRNGEKIKE